MVRLRICFACSVPNTTINPYHILLSAMRHAYAFYAIIIYLRVCVCRFRKICAEVKDMPLPSICFAMDGWEGITLYIGSNPLTGAIWDMPCVEKATLPPPPNARRIEEGIGEEEFNAPQVVLERIKHIEAPKPGGKARGTVSIELISTIEQQVFLLFSRGMELFSPTQMWPVGLGAPILSTNVLRPHPANAPNLLVLCSDQEASQLLASQAAAWAGLRVVHHYDFNHRDHNDLLKTAPKHLWLVLSLLSKCATGPFKTGTWRKVLVDTAEVLCSNVEMLSK